MARTLGSGDAVSDAQNTRISYRNSWLEVPLLFCFDPDMETGPTWRYAVEYTADRPLTELLSAAHQYLRRSNQAHEIVVEQPARVVVKFSDLHSAERFYWQFRGKFVALPIGRSPD